MLFLNTGNNLHHSDTGSPELGSPTVVCPDAFTAVVDGEKYPAYDFGYDSKTLVEPVAGYFYTGNSFADSGTTTEGWIVFGVVKDHGSLSIQADLSENGEMVVEWTDDT